MTRYVPLALRLFMAVVFLYAAYTKLKDSYLIFAMAIDGYQLLPPWAVEAVARTLPAFELVLGLALLVGWKLKYTSAAATALLGFFLGLMIFTYARGLSIDCGCFGAGEPLSAKTLARDGGLVACSLALAWFAWRQPAPVQHPA